MVHAATTGHHGIPWKREMIRLREAGAPLAEPENKVRLDDWSGLRVSKQQFRSTVQDALIDTPDIGLSQAVRYFISNEGGPTTIREFLERYPWARKVFRQVKREHAENEARTRRFLQQFKSAAPVNGED
jgi:hypothetical protein